MDDNELKRSVDSDILTEDMDLQELVQFRRRLEGAMLAGDVAWWQMNVETGEVTFHDNKVEMYGLDPAAFDHYEDRSSVAVHTL